ncbi:MAG: chorismate mutase [Candidatus Neomarinimicrobiota bacterium]|nr:MAG: hypothetical protein CBC68_04020 [Candidatus Marinimicrobia bacterium TMED108]RCL89896.1 MAG: hypothetical protein DBW60_02930 [bacterium]|tara:strand:- start:918 stop:1190 length:273 start_codon:yes stop_codon:yes gene_type:complete
MSSKNKIKEFREKINSIDNRIIKLLEERFLIAKEIGQIKFNSNNKILDAKREREIIDNLNIKTKIISKESLSVIYKNIFKVSREIQSLKK